MVGTDAWAQVANDDARTEHEEGGASEDARDGRGQEVHAKGCGFGQAQSGGDRLLSRECPCRGGRGAGGRHGRMGAGSARGSEHYGRGGEESGGTASRGVAASETSSGGDGEHRVSEV